MLLTLVLVRWVVLAGALALTAAVVPDVEVSGGVFGLLGVAAVYGLVNVIIGPIVRLLTLPITLLTFGLFALVVNGALLALTAGLSDNLDVGGFIPAIIGAVIISLISMVVQFTLVDWRAAQPA